ncbi:MAG: type II toxin-antitoxin system death-on-curing family toxin [Subdoligranulum sp.]|nr:type II toxin-antitoxin system death-on-curing family toxin [Subdoligranulum sp.]
MIVLTVDEIVLLHEKLLTATGGASGLRDRGLLESAVFAMNAGFEEIEQYPTVEEKAARLAYALTQNHAFVDGNKRVGMLAMLTTLALNEVEIHYTQAELIELGLGVASGLLQYDGILDWIRQHGNGKA